MSSCASVATETQFETQVVTSDSLSTSFSSSVSTEPATTITSTATICLDTVTSATCTSSTTSLSVVTTGGSTSTISVPVVITVPVVQTSSRATRTLFSTSCAPTTPPSTPPTTPPTSPPSQTSTSTPPPSLLSETTPPPLTLTSASSMTLSNGSVVTTNVVLTQTSPPTSVYVTASAPAFNNDGNKGSSAKVAPIVGGVVGGLVGLVALLGGIYLLWRRSQRWNDIFDREEDEKEHRRMSLGGEDVQPRPYHYGLVGHSASPTPPSSPPFEATERPGHSPSNSLSLLNAAVRVHSRSSSGQDISPASMSRSASDLAVPPAGHTRPNLSTASSTAASTRPLLERTVNSTRPQSSWSTGAQSIGHSAGADLFDGGRMQSPPPQSPRPHSAGAGLPSGAAAAFIPGAASTDTLPAPRSSPVNEKRRLREALPAGAAAPVPPSSSISATSGSGAAPQGAAPPLTPRSPHRPSSSKGGVLVHTDGGSASDRQGSSGGGPPAYSPT